MRIKLAADEFSGDECKSIEFLASWHLGAINRRDDRAHHGGRVTRMIVRIVMRH